MSVVARYRSAYQSESFELTSPPDLTEALRVDAVATPSPASDAGIEVGDVLLSVDDRPAQGLSLVELTQRSDRQRHDFYRVASGTGLRIQASGIPLGVRCARTNEAVVARARRKLVDDTDLLALWLRYADDALEEVTRPWSARPPSRLRGILSMLLPIPFSPYASAWLFKGVALYERGEHEAGLQVLHAFREEWAPRHMPTFGALPYYYDAQELRRAGRTEEALDAFLESYHAHPHPRTALAIRQLGGDVPDTRDPHLGRPFPIDYALPLLEQPAETRRLSRALAELRPGQIHLVTLLGGYRENLPYDELMQSYVGIMTHFADVVPSMHVIAGDYSPGPWRAGERAASERKLPFEILHDPRSELAEHVYLPGSPHCMALDASGNVRWTGRPLCGVEIWSMLSAAAA
jgi:hypothetical protein